MHRKPKLNTLAKGLCLLVSVAIHFLLLSGKIGLPSTTAAQIEFQPGRSVVELTLLPSVASPARQPETAPPPPATLEEPIPVPQVNEPAELSLPEPETEPPPEILPEIPPAPDPEPELQKPVAESIDHDADLKPKGIETAASSAQALIPTYPRLSRRRGEEGTVILSIIVSATGRPEQIDVVQSSGYTRLDKAAVSTARRSRFVPATRNGSPIQSSFEHRFIFNLEDE